MLKDAKARATASLDGPSKAVLHTVEGRSGETILVEKDGLPLLPVLVLRQLEGCTVRIAADVAAIKLQLEGCTNTTLQLDGKLLTETLEAWKCNDCELRLGSKVARLHRRSHPAARRTRHAHSPNSPPHRRRRCSSTRARGYVSRSSRCYASLKVLQSWRPTTTC